MTLLTPDTPEYNKAQKQFLKATKNRKQDLQSEWSPFRAAEKRFKARFPPPDLSSVLDLATKDQGRHQEILSGGWVGSLDACETIQISPKEQVYTIPRIPGLVILPSFLSHDQQKTLIKWSLSEHAKPPNDTNLDTHYILPEKGLWNAYLDVLDETRDDYLVQPRASNSSSVLVDNPGPRQLVNNTPASLDTLDSINTTPKLPAAPSPTIQPTLVSNLVSKLRWANIGWYYHWGTKQYDFTKGKAPINPNLRTLCKSAVRAVDWSQVHAASDEGWGEHGPDWHTWEETYEPDAGIVNFYQEKDTLMAHVDRSEVCATSPLVSISLGNASVFLIGGLTRDSDPIPILLRSGDVVIMSGPACRRAYHGVPRILEGTLPPHLQDGDSNWEPYSKYIRSSRINVNVRQVFPIGFQPNFD
ncbi:hypothetical protein BJ165DRAFT_1519542 [Panaeolus papilionaceus]|nr:hypothetical protein BJ165DRAFT_1519542 [Panaeolus papilionaceus]